MTISAYSRPDFPAEAAIGASSAARLYRMSAFATPPISLSRAHAGQVRAGAVDGRTGGVRDAVNHIETVVSRYRGTIPSRDESSPAMPWKP
jgi:hypothetical protein